MPCRALLTAADLTCQVEEMFGALLLPFHAELLDALGDYEETRLFQNALLEPQDAADAVRKVVLLLQQGLTACTLWGEAWCYWAVEPTDQMQPVRFDSGEELLQLSDAVCEGLLETGDFDECELWPL